VADNQDFTQRWYQRDWAFIAGFALLKIIIHLPFLSRYGYHHDELYFIACGNHLDLGYVDHPPLVPWIARLVTELFGHSLFGLRIFALLSGAAAVFLTGHLVRRLGGDRFAQGLACLAMLITPVFLRTGNLFCITAFELLFWILGYHIIITIIREDRPWLWLWLGLVVGLGLLTKFSLLFFVFGLVVGLLLTDLRKHFKSYHLYAAGIFAFLIFLPNILWQIKYGWPTISFIINLNKDLMEGISLFQFITGQFLYMHPLNAVIWIAGLFFFFSRKGKPYRLLGWLWISVFVLLMISKSKIYYLAPAYPSIIAGGSIVVGSWLHRRGKIWLRYTVVTILAVGGIALMPLSVPMLPLRTTEQYMDIITFGAFENIFELTGDLRGMFGWMERVNAVAKVYNSLPEGEKKRAIILAAGYGNAGAVDYFGKPLGLPEARSLSMSYWLWGLPEGPIETVIGMGFSKKSMEGIFHEVELAAEIELEQVNPWETPFPITICRQPKKSLHSIWSKNRPW
jgi:4-amino-4-deoxy-L-arabinose transferase-like glycosyltransferase